MLKQRHQRRDDALRKKIDTEVTRRSTSSKINKSITNTGNAIHSAGSTISSNNTDSKRRYGKNTVSSLLRPNEALTVPSSNTTVLAASQLMASKRSDAILALDEHGQLAGILTDKDVAYRVVAEGLDLRTTIIKDVMTQNPTSVTVESSRNAALNIMVERRFRHLPVVSQVVVDDEYEDEGSNESRIEVIGLLDITKCVFERLDDLEKKVLEDQNIASAVEALNRRGNVGSGHIGAVLQGLGPPDVGSLLSEIAHIPEVGPKATIRDAARVMKQTHQTAVLVIDGEKLNGIFTTKDIVLRVVAAGLDPTTTSIVRVMTHHPDSIPPDFSILDALKKLHAGHYLHLPVVENKAPIGLVDVMQLTLSMLSYMMNKDQASTAEGTGPVWDRFWNSTFSSQQSARNPSEMDRHSVTSTDNIRDHELSLSNSGGLAGVRRSGSNIALVDDSMSAITNTSNAQNTMAKPPPTTVDLDEGKFAWKLRDPSSSRVHRFTATYRSFEEFTKTVICSLSIPTFDEEGLESTLPDKLYFLDEDGDSVQINSDSDLTEAVDIAKRVGWNRVVVYLGEPKLETRVADTAAQMASAQAAQLTEAVTKEMEAIKDDKQKETPVGNQLPISPIVLNVALTSGVVLIALYIYNRFIKD